MKRWINIAVQVSLSLGQIINIKELPFEPSAKALIAMGLAIIQVLVSAIAHEYNPDGTPAQCPYHPEPKAKAAGQQ